MIAHVINPGSSNVKLACATIEPSLNPTFPGQLRLSLERVELPLSTAPSAHALDTLVAQIQLLTRGWPTPDAVVGRGGQIGRVPAGTYRLTPELAQRALMRGGDEWPSDLGASLALKLAQASHVPGFIVDPQSVDELLPEAHMTGVAGVRREAQFHALNARLVARRAATEIGKSLKEARIVVAHLGATSSVTAFDQGRAIDTTGTGSDGGPIGSQQSGPLPTRALLTLAETHSVPELLHMLSRESGFKSLTGSANLKELESREAEDTAVQAATAAFVHQACKAVGEQSAALSGRPDAIALTGGIARWDALVNRIERRIGWIAPLVVVPGELELEALAEGVGRVMFGLEGVREWSPDAVSTQPATPLFSPLPSVDPV